MFKRLHGGSSPASIEERDRRVDQLYRSGCEALEREAYVEAGRHVRQALALDPSLPSLHYLLGLVLFDMGEFASAVGALDACLERGPRYPLASHAQAKSALARTRLNPGHDPPRERSASAAPHVSVIVCSVTPAKFERVSANYGALLAGLEHEIIGIHDARSLSEGYNRGIRRARGEILVFSHDDIEILSPDFSAKLANRMAEFDLIGTAGTDLVGGGTWVDSGWPHVFGQIGMPAPSAGRILVTNFVMRGASAAPMQALDGVFLAARREVAERVGFDEQTFDRWHLYDLDFSYSAFRAGFKCAACNDLLIVHESPGNYDALWHQHAKRFITKHLGRPADDYVPVPIEICTLEMASAREWRLFTHHMTRVRN